MFCLFQHKNNCFSISRTRKETVKNILKSFQNGKGINPPDVILIIIRGFNFKQNGARPGCFQGFNSLSTTLSMPLWSAKW